MKAFLLAAGLGTRLRPLTDHAPKCMLPIGRRPLLGIWLEAMARAGVDEVLVNLHHMPEVVLDYLADEAAPLKVVTAYEPRLLGSAGTVLANRDWVDSEDFFLVCYADNLTDFDLTALVDHHVGSGSPAATVAVFKAPVPSACGIVELDGDDRIVGFIEKPPFPTSDLANAGIYTFAPEVLDQIQPAYPRDIGFHLLPKLVGRAIAVRVPGYFRDIGTPEAYRRAQEEWPARFEG